jgi:hypothetical protein
MSDINRAHLNKLSSDSIGEMESFIRKESDQHLKTITRMAEEEFQYYKKVTAGREPPLKDILEVRPNLIFVEGNGSLRPSRERLAGLSALPLGPIPSSVFPSRFLATVFYPPYLYGIPEDTVFSDPLEGIGTSPVADSHPSDGTMELLALARHDDPLDSQSGGIVTRSVDAALFPASYKVPSSANFSTMQVMTRFHLEGSTLFTYEGPEMYGLGYVLGRVRLVVQNLTSGAVVQAVSNPLIRYVDEPHGGKYLGVHGFIKDVDIELEIDVDPNDTLVSNVSAHLYSMVPKESNVIAVGNFSSMVSLIQPPGIISVPYMSFLY